MTSHPLFWTAQDFDSPLLNLADALGDLAGESRMVFFDLFAADTPEAARLPMSYWTKERILFYVENSAALRPTRDVLKDMLLEDLRAVALVKVGRMPTGRRSDEGWRAHEWRNTEFYSLNIGWLLPLAEALMPGATPEARQ